MNLEQVVIVLLLSMIVFCLLAFVALLISQSRKPQNYAVLKKAGQKVKIASDAFVVSIEAKTLSESFFRIRVEFPSTLTGKILGFDISDTLPINRHQNCSIGAFSGSLQIANTGNGKFSVFLMPK